MSTQKDPLFKSQSPDRVYYAFGALLDENDFSCEQTYHRGRLGRMLSYLHGSGTVAGTEVVLVESEEEDVIKVSSGLVIDRLGRLIEVPRLACIRIERWLTSQLEDSKTQDKLLQSFRAGTDGEPDGVFVDVFIKFEVCERGKQPAFATGNYDALDSIAPSRLRDSYKLELVIREEDSLPVPDSEFPDLTGMTDEQIKERVIQYKLKDAWKESTAWTGPGETLTHLGEHVLEQDGTEMLLARILIPMTNPPLVRNTNVSIRVNNTLRRFAYSTAELAWLTDTMR